MKAKELVETLLEQQPDPDAFPPKAEAHRLVGQTRYMLVLYNQRDDMIAVDGHNLSLEEIDAEIAKRRAKGMPAFRQEQQEEHDDSIEPDECPQCEAEINRITQQ